MPLPVRSWASTPRTDAANHLLPLAVGGAPVIESACDGLSGPAYDEPRARKMHRHVSDERVVSADRDFIDR
jgi:hypothetical protein